MGTRKEGEGEGKIKAAKGVKQVKSYTFFFFWWEKKVLRRNKGIY